MHLLHFTLSWIWFTNHTHGVTGTRNSNQNPEPGTWKRMKEKYIIKIPEVKSISYYEEVTQWPQQKTSAYEISIWLRSTILYLRHSHRHPCRQQYPHRPYQHIEWRRGKLFRRLRTTENLLCGEIWAFLWKILTS